MNTALKTLGLISVGVVAGVVLTPAPDSPEPKVKHEVHVVKLPPKIITKKVEGKTKYKTHPMPETCETALDYIKLANEVSNDIHNKSVKYFTYIDKITVRRMSQYDTENKTVEWLANHEAEMDKVLIDLLTVNDRAENAWNQCVSDVERQREGDDIPDADGVHVRTP